MYEINGASEEGGLVLAGVRDGVLRVTLNRPERRNALSTKLIAAIAAAFQQHASNADIRIAVLTGAGDKSFAAGGDLHELASMRSEEATSAFSVKTRHAFDAVRSFPVPVVAALNGDALGGGAELAVACDFRIAAAHARIGFLQGRLNITTAWGGVIDLMALLGPSKALELLCSSRALPAEEAAAIGLVNTVARTGQSFGEAVDGFLSGFAHQKPQVMRGFKRQALAQKLGLPRTAREEMETRDYTDSWLHEDHWIAAEAVLAGLRR